MKRRSIQDFDPNAFSERMTAETDRSCAVLGAAVVDAKLEDVFKRRLKGSLKELFDGMGPLGTFSSRIRLAHALAWIDDATQADLHVIRSIRNDFAHSFDHDLSFSDPSILARCSNLKISQAFIDGFDDAINAPDQNLAPQVVRSMQQQFTASRWRYQLAIDFLIQQLDEIPSDNPFYAGTDLLHDVRALSANSRIRPVIKIQNE